MIENANIKNIDEAIPIAKKTASLSFGIKSY